MSLLLCKQKTAYELRISDWSSDVCSSDLVLLAAVERGDISDSAWDHIDARLFWKWRLLSDIVSAYYTHPSAWSAIGFGGPASPRGYVRLAEIGSASCRERIGQYV